MKDQRKTEKQLIDELTRLKQRISEWEELEKERKQLEEKLREYERVIENSQDMVVVVDKDYKYALANDRFLKYRGLEKDQVIGRSVRDVVGVDIFERTIKKNLEACFRGEVIQYEMKHVYPELGERDLLVQYFPIENPDGINRVVSIIQDITGLKHAEAVLRESEIRFATIFHASPVAIAITRLKDGKLVDVNEAWQKATGFTRAEAIGRTPIELNSWVNPGDRDRLIAKLQEQGTVQDFEFQVRHKSGSIPDMLMSAEMIELAGERCMLSLAQDITERKRMENALRESEQRFLQMAENIEVAFWMESGDGSQLHYLSPGFEKIWGFPGQDVMRNRDLWLRAIHPEDLPGVLQWAKGNKRRDVFDVQEFRIVRPDGEIRWVRNRAFPIRNEQGEIYRVVGFIEDITGRKETEDELRKSREFLNSILDNAPMLIYVVSADNSYRLVNKAWEEFMGKDREEVIGLSMEQVFSPIIARRFLEQNQEVLNHGLPLLIEEEIPTPLGTHHFYTNKFPLFDDRGKVEAVGGISLDITERKQGEERIRKLTRFLEAVIDNANTWIDVLDGNANVLIWNKAAEMISGYSSQEVMGHDRIWEWLYPDGTDQERLKDRVVQLMQRPGEDREIESVIRTKAGQSKIILWHSRNLEDNEGSPIGSVVLGQDITERKRAEEALKETNQNLQALIQASPLAIVTVDSHKNILKWNPAAERMFGWTEQEVLGQPTPIIPRDKQTEFQKIFEEVLRGEAVSGFETRRQKKDGTLIDVRLSIAPVYGVHSKVEGSMAILEDITERKKTEDERQQLLGQLRAGRKRLRDLSRRLVELQEAERRDLSRELHDEVGQSLTALSINLNIIENLVPKKVSAKINGRIEDSQRLVEETITRIRDVMAKLRPPVLDDYGLLAALNWFGKQFEERTGIAVTLSGDELADRFPSKTETALFRITQEALTNITKHAEASQVTVTVESRDGGLRLIIADNGMGFDPEVHHQPGTRPEWGLINMRERALSIGGRLQVETAPGKGTKITVEVPKQT